MLSFPREGGPLSQSSESMVDVEALLDAARHQVDNSRAPYSRFHVGAALWSDSQIFGGCNVENASYGLTLCAERGAVMNWAAAGAPGTPGAIAIAARGADSGEWSLAMPCGACRQVLSELPGSSELTVWIWDGTSSRSMSLLELLPHAFNAADLRSDEE